MSELYDEHIMAKQKRKGKTKGKRNPIASSHNKGSWNAGPMVSKKDKGGRGRVDMRDHDEFGD